MVAASSGHAENSRLSPFKLSVAIALSAFSCSSSPPTDSSQPSYPAYVLAYPDMPKVGVRPIDVNGLSSGSHGIHPCVLPFMRREFRRLGLPVSHLNRVRFRSASEPLDAINDLAFSKNFRAITRDEDIYVNTPEMTREAFLGERLFFHEMVHTAQFQSGELSLSSYALSSMKSFASGQGPHDNSYEDQAVDLSYVLLGRWQKSRDRKGCYADADKPVAERRVGKRADVIVLFAAWDKKEQRYLPYSVQF